MLGALGAFRLIPAGLALGALFPFPARAQARDLSHAPATTLALWVEDVWLALTDRDGAYFGRLAGQGTFQRFNPLMDDEYELDTRTGLFGDAEDARWAGVTRGLRVVGASINHPFILNFADWRDRFAVSSRVDLEARYRRQRSLTTQRDYTTVGLAWRRALGTWWTIGTSIGMHFFKSSADVEIALSRVWTGRRGMRLEADARFAFLDAFNNVIFNALGVEPEETPAHFDYRRLPVAARAGVSWTAGRGRLEVHAGSSNRSRVEVTFPASGDPAYAQDERVSFAGALAELVVSGRARVAVHATIQGAATDRAFLQPSSDGFRLREETRAVGGYATIGADQSLVLEASVAALWRPEHRDRGDGTAVRHRDRELFALLALARRPNTGWLWRLGYACDDRTAGVLAPWLTATNHRQLMEGGYRFRTGFEVTAGLRWDLDEGLRNPFDGGHLRFTATRP